MAECASGSLETVTLLCFTYKTQATGLLVDMVVKRRGEGRGRLNEVPRATPLNARRRGLKEIRILIKYARVSHHCCVFAQYVVNMAKHSNDDRQIKACEIGV